MNMKIHTRGWKGSAQIRDGEEADVMFGAIVEIDGHLVERVTRVRVLSSNDEFTYVTVNFVPGELDIVTHTQDSWKALMEKVPA